MAIGWGILGTGNQADRIIAPVLGRASNTKFVAICSSRGMERARSFTAKHVAERAYD